MCPAVANIHSPRFGQIEPPHEVRQSRPPSFLFLFSFGRPFGGCFDSAVIAVLCGFVACREPHEKLARLATRLHVFQLLMPSLIEVPLKFHVCAHARKLKTSCAPLGGGKLQYLFVRLIYINKLAHRKNKIVLFISRKR